MDTNRKARLAEQAVGSTAGMHPRVIEAQAREAKIAARRRKRAGGENVRVREFPSRVVLGETAEQVLERKMLHGEES